MSDTIVRLLFMILVFGATVLAIEGGVRWLGSTRRDRQIVNKRLQQVERRVDQGSTSSLRRTQHGRLFEDSAFEKYFAGIDQILREAGLRTSPTEAFLRMIGAALAIFMAFLMLATFRQFPLSIGGLSMMILFAVAIGIVLPMMFFSRRREKRKKKLSEQFPIALDLFVRGLRAGHPVSSALDLLTSDMRDPIRAEFAVVVDEVTYGLSLREALENMANRCGLEDMHMFVVSLSVQSETGGNLAEILEGLSGVIRARQSMVLKVRALSSEGRISAIMLTALPVLTFCLTFSLNPKFYMEVANDKAFVPGFAGLFLLYLLGVVIIRRMVDLKV